MVTKLVRATGRAEYGLPVWFFSKFQSLPAAEISAVEQVSRPATGIGI
jgi:hypothetical protein